MVAFARIISGGFHLRTQKWLEKLEQIRSQLERSTTEERDEEWLLINGHFFNANSSVFLAEKTISDKSYSIRFL